MIFCAARLSTGFNSLDIEEVAVMISLRARLRHNYITCMISLRVRVNIVMPLGPARTTTRTVIYFLVLF